MRVYFALRIAPISRFKTSTRSFDEVRFGNILGVTDGDLTAVFVVVVATFAAVAVGFKYLLFTTFEIARDRCYQTVAVAGAPSRGRRH